MPAKLTTEGLAARLPLLNAKGVCLEAGVDYMRFRFTRGKMRGRVGGSWDVGS